MRGGGSAPGGGVGEGAAAGQGERGSARGADAHPQPRCYRGVFNPPRGESGCGEVAAARSGGRERGGAEQPLGSRGRGRRGEGPAGGWPGWDGGSHGASPGSGSFAAGQGRAREEATVQSVCKGLAGAGAQTLRRWF